MAKELGQTTEPRELVPGNVESIASTKAWLKSYGDSLHSAGEGLKRIDTVDGWTGKAGDEFRAAFKGEPGKWLEAGDCFHDAADALAAYESTLTWAQGQARDAVREWNEAREATGRAQAEHREAEGNAGSPIPFVDPGQSAREAAQRTLATARGQVAAAGDTAAARMARARDKAPKEPGFLDKVGGFLSGAGDFLLDAGQVVVEDVASVGNALIHDPGAAVEIAGGLAIAAAGAGGEVLGAGLDLTGAGAVVGVPVNVLSAGVIATGLGMAGVGASGIAEDAAGPNRVHMERDGGGGGGGSGGGETRPSRPVDPNAAPEGRPTNIPKKSDEATERSLRRENESAQILARNGYKVEQNPNLTTTEKNPDYRIEGDIWDCYSPSSAKPRSIHSGIAEKVNKDQADRIVLNMSDTEVDLATMKKQLQDWPIDGLKEVKVIDKAGNVVHFYP
ncbi:putative T7SS-secreted protein [Kitasatospora purpeofusca]|uniref:putative T7SS-secreted protein n=1 Tax=Kitasatospora purpeofusca TaxID=67352 RepID=UPI0033DD8408